MRCLSLVGWVITYNCYGIEPLVALVTGHLMYGTRPNPVVWATLCMGKYEENDTIQEAKITLANFIPNI